MRPLALALLAHLLLVAAAHASLVFPQPKPLPEVVALSEVIVVVTPAKGRSRVLSVPMRKGAPYPREQTPWIVTEVLRGDAKLVGRTIYLDVYRWQLNISMNEAFREGGPVPSTYEPSYKPLGKPPSGAEPRVFFLRPSYGEPKDAFEPVVIDGVESVKYLDDIKAAIRNPPPASPPRGIGQP